MGNEASSDVTKHFKKYQVTSHEWPVGFRKTPTFADIHWDLDTNLPHCLHYPTIVTLRSSSEVTEELTGITYIQVIDEGYKDLGYLPLTSPVHGELLAEYDGKKKSEKFRDEQAFESLGKNKGSNREYQALQENAARVREMLRKEGLNDPNMVFEGVSNGEAIARLQAFTVHRNKQADEMAREMMKTEHLGKKVIEHLDRNVAQTPEWMFAKQLYKDGAWATKHGFHAENGHTFAFEEDDVLADREALELPDEVWNVGLKKGEKGESAPQQPHDPFDESWDKTPMETVTVR